MPNDQDPNSEFRYDHHAAFRKVTVDRLTTPASPFGNALAAADKLVAVEEPDQLLRVAVEILRRDIGLERCGIFLLDEEAGLFRGTWGTGIDGSTTDEHHVAYAADDTTARLIELMAARSHHWCLMKDAQLVDYAASDPERIVLPQAGWVAATSIASFQRFRGFLFNDTASTACPPDPFQQEAAAMFCALLGNQLEIKEGEQKLRQANLLLEERIEQRTRDLAAESAQRRREKQRLETILASLDEAIVAVDAQERVVLCNRSAQQLMRCSPVDLAGLQAALPLLDPRTQDSLWGRLCGRESNGILTACLAGQPGVELEVIASPLSDEEQDGGFVLALRDRTEQESLRHERERTERLTALAQVVGGIAHDFNNILTALQGRLSLLSELGLPELDVHLKPSTDAMCRAEKLVGQLLTLVRGQRAVREPMRPDAVLASSLELARSGSAMRVRRTGLEELPLLLADTSQLGQVFQNLAINARQAMALWRIGGPNQDLLEVDSSLVSNGDETWLQIEFRDHGPGIPASLLQKVFEPLFTTRPDGHGLGLATCQTIVDHHGGVLSLLNRPEGGACARIRLPLAPPGTPDPASGSGPLDEVPPSSQRILVVDDQRDILDTLASILETLGMEVLACSTGEEAISAQQDAIRAGNPWPLLLLDRHLREGMDCLAVRRALQDAHPPLRCMVMSGDPEDPVMQAPQAYGFQMSLPKPFGLATLRKAIKALQQHSQG